MELESLRLDFLFNKKRTTFDTNANSLDQNLKTSTTMSFEATNSNATPLNSIAQAQQMEENDIVL